MTSPTSTDWRTPFVILLAGTTIVFLSLGARMTFGLWMPDASFDLFGPNQLKILSLSIALQSLFWGIGTPVAGNIADKYGTGRVIAAAGILYSIGLVMMTVSTTPFMAHLSIGVFTGFAMSGAMFPIILSAISRAVSPEKRNLYLGIASAGGSSGQVLMIPMGQYFIDSQGWVVTLYILAAVTALIVPLAFVMMTRKAEAQTGPALQVLTTGAAIREAFGHRGYVLLTGGYFVCGLQTMFIGTHFPNMLTSLKVDATIAALSLSLIGAFNILGTFTWGAMLAVFAALAGDDRLYTDADNLNKRTGVLGPDGAALARHGAVDGVYRRPGLRAAPYGHAVRLCLCCPSAWQLYRYLRSGLFLRHVRQLQRCLVGRDHHGAGGLGDELSHQRQADRTPACAAGGLTPRLHGSVQSIR